MTDVLSQAQRTLGRALDRARVSEDRVLANEVRERGVTLTTLLHGSIRMAHLYAPDNHAFDAPATELASALATLVDRLGVLHLVVVEDQVYLNDIRVRFAGDTHAPQGLAAELARHNVGGLRFHDALDAAEARRLMACLAAAAPGRGKRAALAAALREAGLTQVELEGLQRFILAGEAPPEPPSERELGAAAQLVVEAWDSVGEGRALNPLPLRRVIAAWIERGPRAPGLWRDVIDAPEHAAHAVRVARAALLLGRALGLEAGALQDLGVAALVHDIGYAAEAISEERDAHGIVGARAMLRQHGFHAAKVVRVLALAEHHYDFARAGRAPVLVARILRIAEDYDLLTLDRGGAMSPPRALATMLGAAGRAYDPALLQLFVNAMGAYPPGTWLDLGDGRLGQSACPVRSPDTFDEPLVRTLDDALVDLAREPLTPTIANVDPDDP